MKLDQCLDYRIPHYTHMWNVVIRSLLNWSLVFAVLYTSVIMTLIFISYTHTHVNWCEANYTVRQWIFSPYIVYQYIYIHHTNNFVHLHFEVWVFLDVTQCWMFWNNVFLSISRGMWPKKNIYGLLSDSVSNSTLHTTELLDHGQS